MGATPSTEEIAAMEAKVGAQSTERTPYQMGQIVGKYTVYLVGGLFAVMLIWRSRRTRK
jgi:hypothetical protein